MFSKGITLPGTPHGIEVRRAKKSADKWRNKALELERDQDALKQFVHNAVAYENDLEIQMGRLKENRDIIHSQMKMREKGLILRQHKENHFKSDITELQQRIEEMARMIRHKEAEVEALRFKNHTQRQEINILKAKLANKGKGLRQVPEHKILPQEKQGGPGNKKVTLPTLVGSNLKPLFHGSKETLLSDKDSAIDTDKSYDTIEDDISKRSIKELLLTSQAKESSSCIMTEKTVGNSGASLLLPNANLVIPANAMDSTHRVALTSITLEKTSPLVINMKAAGLWQLIKPKMKISLQPFNIHLQKNAVLQLNIDRDYKGRGKKARVFVCFMQTPTPLGDDFSWHPEKSTTMTSVSELSKSSVVSVNIEQLTGITVLELDPESSGNSETLTRFSDPNFLPDSTKNAPASGIVSMTGAALNNKTISCTFIVFALEGDEETLRVTCISSSSDQKEALLFRQNDIKVTHFGTATSKMHLCHEEVISFYFDKDVKYTGAMAINMNKAQGDGQRYRLPFFSCGSHGAESDESETQGQLPHPTLMRVRRRIMTPHHILEDNICIIHIHSTRRNFKL